MSKGGVRSWEEWVEHVPDRIKQDAIWHVKAYQLALFVGDLSWHDVTELLQDRRTRGLADQLYRSVGSIRANITEGFSRRSGKVSAQFYEYALGSARESRDWYYHGRHVLGEAVVAHRMDTLSEIIRLLTTMIPQQREQSLDDRPGMDVTTSSEVVDTPSSLPEPSNLEQSRPSSLLVTHSSFPTLQPTEAESTLESRVVSRRGDVVMVGGEGCWMIDAEGRRYLDMTSSQGVAMLGYGHPRLAGAIGEQARRLHACPSFFYNDVRAAFLEKLMQVMPPHLGHAFLANSGAETIDGAIKFARLATGRTGIVAAKGSFHGRTVGAVSLTWNPKYRKKFEPLLPGVTHVKYNDLDALAATVDDDTAAVFLEVIQGEGGVNEGTAAYLTGAQELCRERGALLVIDEIQTGFGRTGQWFGFQHFDLEPDIIALAKGLGGGFPMGAIVYTDQVQDALYVGAHGSTFGGNPLACAAGLAAITTYQEEGLIERAAQQGQKLRSKLESAIGDRPSVREIRGKGLMLGIDLRVKVGPLLKILMEEHRVLALPAGSTVLRLLPPLIIEDEEIDLAVEAIAAALHEA